MSVVTCFDLATSSAVQNVLTNVSAHPFPVVVTRQQFERLRSSRVAYRRVVMVLSDYLHSEVFKLGNVDLISIVQESVFVSTLSQLQKRVSSLTLLQRSEH